MMTNAKTGETLTTAKNVTFTAEDTHAYLMIVQGERVWFPANKAEAEELEANGETVCEVVA